MTNTVHIVDYGIGNLYSVARAIERAGGEAQLTTDWKEIGAAERLILPGVGAFEPCARTLRDLGLVEPVIEFARSGRPFMGICVGMQLLFDYSEEFGVNSGLGLIHGHVAAIPADGVRKVPHIGWSPLVLPETRTSWAGSVLEQHEPGQSSAYFVHSYSCVPVDRRHRLANVDYAGYEICAAVQSENVTGFQCHPEKSGNAGLKILQNFLEL